MNSNVWVNASKLMDIVEDRARDYMKGTSAAGLPVKYASVLHALYTKDGQPATDLARAIGKPATSFTPILDAIEARGLISRQPDPNDRRAIFVHLTPEGEALRKDIEAAMYQLGNAFAKLKLLPRG